ncbi:MAG: hypothetical protein ACR2IF_03720 [Terriglobales bacterium]
MSKGLKLLGILAVVAIAISALAADMPGVGRTYNLTIINPVKVGNTVLQAGDYKVKHIMEGNQHVMVFKLDSKEVVRANCTMEPVKNRAESTMQEVSTANGGRTLVAVTFAGEKIKHVF